MIYKLVPETKVHHCNHCPYVVDAAVMFCSKTTRSFTTQDLREMRLAIAGTERAFPSWCPLQQITEADA